MQRRATELYIQRIFIRAFIEYANQFELISWSMNNLLPHREIAF